MTAQRETTRDRILDAAEAVFADKGYHETLVDEISRRTSLSKGGVYFHFPSKEDLFFAVLDKLAGRLVEKAEKAASRETSPLAAADAALVAVLTSLSKRKRLARLILVQGYSMGPAFEKKRVEIYGRFAGVITSSLGRAVEAGEIAPVNTEIVARLWLGAVNEIVVNWLYNGTPTPAESLPLLRQVLIGGLPQNPPLPAGEAGRGVLSPSKDEGEAWNSNSGLHPDSGTPPTRTNGARPVG